MSLTPFYESPQTDAAGNPRAVLYCGDSAELVPSLPLDEFGLVVTDPPYGIGWTRGVHAARQSKAHAGIENDEDTSCRDDVLAMLLDLPRVVFGSFYAPYPAETKQVLVWHKPPDSGVVGSVTGYRRDCEPVFLAGPWPQRKVQASSVLRSQYRSAKQICADTGHPHTKPTDLLQMLLRMAPDGPVLDPFAGSGSTGVACMAEGRRFVGVELKSEYCEIAARRIDAALSQTSLFPVAA